MILSYATKAALALVLAGMAGSVSQAQETDTNWFVGGSIFNQLDSAKNITNQSLGFGLTAGRDFQYKGYVFRTGLAINNLPATKRTGQVYENVDPTGSYYVGAPTNWSNKTSLMGYQVFGDFIFPSGFEKLDLSFGVSINRWFYNAKVDPDSTGAYTITPHSQNDHVAGLKGGLRIGAEYRINRNLSAEFMFQIVELGHTTSGVAACGKVDSNKTIPWAPAVGGTVVDIANPMYNQATHGSNENPSWIQLGVKYHF